MSEQKPVAWLSIDSIGERYLCFSKPNDNDEVYPLYTAPPQRKPLPESEVKEMYRGMFCAPLGKRLTHHDWFQAGVLFAETAHGIGENI